MEPGSTNTDGVTTSELDEPRWSVVSFDRCEASGLTYEAAKDTVRRLESEKVAGLCIITDEAAARLHRSGS